MGRLRLKVDADTIEGKQNWIVERAFADARKTWAGQPGSTRASAARVFEATLRDLIGTAYSLLYILWLYLSTGWRFLRWRLQIQFQ